MQIYIQDTPDNHISFQITAIGFAEFAKPVPEVITTRSIYYNKFHLQQITTYGKFNTFTAIVDLSRFNNSCLKSPASTLVDLTFQSRALRSFSLNQLRNLSL